jgi:hypothetical protein
MSSAELSDFRNQNSDIAGRSTECDRSHENAMTRFDYQWGGELLEATCAELDVTVDEKEVTRVVKIGFDEHDAEWIVVVVDHFDDEK